MKSLAVSIATLWRAPRLQKLVQNILETASIVQCEIYFICEDDDQDSIAEVIRLTSEGFPVTLVLSKERDCTKAVNIGAKASHEDFFMVATDDLEFTHFWDVELMKAFDDPSVMVAAPWDGLYERGKSSYIMRREYINDFGTIDEKGLVFHPAYHHDFADCELLDTAIHRGCFKYCPRALVKHCHYNSPFAKYPRDATSERLESMNNAEDRALYESRRHLFAGAMRTDRPFE